MFVHGSLPAAASARRKDVWPNFDEAKKYFTSRGFYRRWDPRALDLHLVLSCLLQLAYYVEIRSQRITHKDISS
jgi:hypothetical protein